MTHSAAAAYGRICRTCLCGLTTGGITALVLLLYKLSAGFVLKWSETGYHFIRERLYLIPAALLLLGGLAFLMAYIYRRWPDLRGGGIPTAIGIIRGLSVFCWIRTLIGAFVLSLSTFLTGVPLGNEGPAVVMGTAVGRGMSRLFGTSMDSRDRLIMTGGGCAGFATATGGLLSGVLFGVEEVQGRPSPSVLLSATVSVVAARVVTELLSPIFGVSVSLFPSMDLPALPLSDGWLPLLLGVAMGLFSVAFLKGYALLQGWMSRVLSKVSRAAVLFGVYALTLAAGLVAFSTVSTGHELVLSLLQGPYLWPLIVILAVRSVLTLCGNTAGVTGGMFVPTLTLGALVAGILCFLVGLATALSPQTSLLLVMLGMTGSIAATMKMPLTALVFALEALSCQHNVMAVVMVVAVSYGITHLFGVNSITDAVLEKATHTAKEPID